MPGRISKKGVFFSPYVSKIYYSNSEFNATLFIAAEKNKKPA